MKFKAIDIETANPNYRSICQIGIATFDGSAIVDRWKSYINPKEPFYGRNIDIHNIDETKVEDAPDFAELYEIIRQKLDGEIVVHHMPFDKSALRQATDYHRLMPLDCRWLDSAKVARRTWSEISKSGYGLKNVCQMIGHEFEHHDALEDAIAAGRIIIAAQADTGLDLNGCLTRQSELITPRNYMFTEDLKPNENGAFYGEVICFTGGLNIVRKEAWEIAASIGMTIDKNFTKKTTMLCVGDVDISKLNGNAITGKLDRAQKAIQKGQNLRILGESDFFDMVEASL